MLSFPEKNKIILLVEDRNIKFTKREIECIINIIIHKTAKGAAKQLSLSHRTVEYYLENIKQKLNCHYRAEIISKMLTCSDFKKLFIESL